MKKTKNGGISRKERKTAKEIKQADRPLLFVFFGFLRLKKEFMLRFKCGVPVLASIGWGFAALGNPWLEFVMTSGPEPQITEPASRANRR